MERVPPQNLEAEQSVLGAMLVAPEAMARVAEILHGDSFYRRDHQLIFDAAMALFERGEPVDLITVSNHLRGKELLDEAGGYGYLMELAGAVATAANVEYYAQIIEDKATLRALIRNAGEIVAKAYQEDSPLETVLDDSERLILEVGQRRNIASLQPIKDILHASFEKIEQRYERQDAIMGVATGFYDFDALTSGLQPSDLLILAARPSMGKTALALNMAQNVAMGGHPVIIFSLEMSAEQLVQRMLCSEAQVDAQRLKTGYLSESDWPKLSAAIGRLGAAPIYIDDTAGITAMEIRSKARRLKAETKSELGLIIIDYLQLMQGGKASAKGGQNREQEIASISRAIKGLARELHVPVLALSQLSRGVESRTDKRPMLSDLRESGSIEQDADLVMFIYRDEYYNKETSTEKNIAEVIIAKHRNGPTDTVKLFFHKELTRFESLSNFGNPTS